VKIRAFDVHKKGKKYCIYLRGIKLLAVDAVHVDKDPKLLDKTVDRLHNELHPILKRIEERPEAFGELIAEFNGVAV
jgi:hypothetical protein